VRLTASKPVSQRAVSKDQMETWLNLEARPLLDQLRTGANAVGIERPVPVVSDGAGTYVVIWTSDVLPAECAWEVEARVAGVGGAQRATYRLVQTVTSIASVVAALGATTTVHAQETAAACDARIVVDAANRVVTVEARDDAATAMAWTVVVTTHEGQA
jgi:hypothetical protein